MLGCMSEGAGGRGNSSVGSTSGPNPVDFEDANNESKVQQLYSGALSVPGFNEEDLPKTKVNVFISSTFDDTKFEQDVLLKRVYPCLRDFCRSLGLGFDVVSMRWGVLARTGDEHLTSELCMSQLEMCKRESVGLCFLTLQGYRYGYRPFPSMITKEEMDRIVQALKDAGKSTALLCEPHWRLDETAEPQVYVLQRISSQPGCSKYLLSEEDKKRGAGDAAFREQREKEQQEASGAWWKLFEQMQVLLREGAVAAGLRQEERDKYFISVTHDEVNRGIINNSKASKQALCFVRNIDGGTTTVRAADPSDDQKTGKEYAEEGEPLDMQEQLKMSVQGVLSSSISNFIVNSVPWVQGGFLHRKRENAPAEWQAYLTQFGERVESEAKRMILSEYREPIRNALLQEVLLQRSFVVDKLKSQGFEREEVVAQLVDSSDEHDRRVTVLHGPSGAGKSWLMCKTISVLRDTLPPEAVLVYRLLGTTRDSSDAFSLIKSLVAQISSAYQGSRRGVDVPSSWSEASEWFASGKAFEGHVISQDTPLVIVLDSLDQLSLQYQATINLGAWLPGLKYALPPHVHLILSTLPEEKGVDILSSLEAMDSSSSSMRFVQVLPLDVTVDAIQAMVQARPAFGTLLPLKRCISGDLAKLVLQLSSSSSSSTSSKSPLFLTLAINIVCQWPSYKACDQAMLLPFRQAAALGVRGLVHYIFGQIEERHGKLLVHRMLGLLTAAKEGLSESELEDLLSCDKDVLEDVFEWWRHPVYRLPPMLVHRVVSDLQAYLVQRGAGGGKVTVLKWYHRQFWEVATERYLSSSSAASCVDDAKMAHELLARYFGNLLDSSLVAARLIRKQPICLTKTGVWWKEAQVNVRRCIEAPHHMMRAGMLDVAVRELCDIERICAYVKAQEGFELVKYLMDLEKLMMMGSAEAERLNHYWRWLSQDMSTIVADPAQWLVATCNGDQPLCSIARQDMCRYLQQESSEASSSCGQEDKRLLFTDKAWNRLSKVMGGHEHFSALLLTLSGHAGAVTCVNWSLDGTKLASSSSDNTVRVWDVHTGSQLVQLQGHSSTVRCVNWSPDGTKLASASDDNTVRVWDAHTGSQLAQLQGHSSYVTSVSWSPDGSRLASGSRDKTVRVWDVHTCSQLAQLQGHSKEVSSVSWSPDGGSKIASASWDNTVRVWDAQAGTQLAELKGHSEAVNSVNWSPDGSKLASASGPRLVVSSDNTVRVWDARTGSQLAELKGHSSTVTRVNWSPDNSKLASASNDKTVRVWDVHTGSQLVELAELKGHSRSVNNVSWSPDNSKLASASHDKTICIWDAHTCLQLAQLQGHAWHVTSVNWSPDGSKLASASEDKSIRVWDAHTGSQLAELKGHSGWVNCVNWSPDGTKLASASGDETVRVWDAHTCSQLAQLQGHSHWVLCVNWSPDGTKLASASEDETIRVWNAHTGSQLVQLQGHSSSVNCVSWSPDGTKLISASDDATIRVWDAHTGSQLAELQSHSSVNCVNWSPDGAKLASASYNNAVCVWDSHTGSQLAQLRGHSYTVTCVAWSPDGTKIASASSDKTVRVWDSVLDV